LKIFVAGATGVLGRRLLEQFCARGHSVAALVRSERGEAIARASGATPRHGELFDEESLVRAGEGAEVVIHAATSIPVSAKPGPRDWEMNDRIRREGTRALANAALRISARIYLQQSIAWVARPADGAPFDENSPPCTDAITQSALDAEHIAQEAGTRGKLRVGILRCGFFYSADAGHTKMMGDRLRKRALPILGMGGAVWSWIHADDAAGAFVASAEAERDGLWHVVDDEPVSLAEYFQFFAKRIAAPKPFHIPPWLGRLFAGEAFVKQFLTSTKTSNEKIRRELRWQLRFPTYREGLNQVAEAWEKEAQKPARGAAG
jgi:nucleoside-diphosphate-sugar epimerase